MVKPPDLLIYLKASVPTLVAQIQNAEENTKKISGWIILKS
jgi:hypothetical protein